MKHKQQGFAHLLLIIIVIAGFVVAVGLYTKDQSSKNSDKEPESVGVREEQKPTEVSDKATFETPTEIGLPVADISDLSGVGAFSTSEATEYKRFHNGIDFMSSRDGVEFIAIADGVVKNPEVFRDPKMANARPQVNLMIQTNESFRYGLAFEPFSDKQEDAEQQLAMLLVKDGDIVKKGQVLGKLLKKGEGAHVHISVFTGKTDKTECFETLFSEHDRQLLTAKVLTDNTITKHLCYL